jgi:hypothetical protein
MYIKGSERTVHDTWLKVPGKKQNKRVEHHKRDHHSEYQ